MAILTYHSLLLHGLRFAAPVRVRVWNGGAVLRSGGVAVELLEGESFDVPSFVRFSCLARPIPGTPLRQQSEPAVWSLSLESDAADIERAADTSKPWSHLLASEIFAAPHHDWSAVHIACRWQMTPARLRAYLFAEGESLRSLVREQRVAFVLARLACIDHVQGDGATDFSTAGFGSAAAMMAACHDDIGLTPEIVQCATPLLSATYLNRANKKSRRHPRYRSYF
jgi:hypothetical protein